MKDADPSALVVVGGYDGLFNPPEMPAMPGQEKSLEFYDYVLREAADAFDVFDLHLYGSPYTIPWRVEYISSRMRAHGFAKPIIATEYNGPGFYEFACNLRFAPRVLQWLQAVTAGYANGDPVAGDAGQKSVAELYREMDKLPAETQMFMQGCPVKLQARFELLQARDLLARNVLALSAGVAKTVYWSLHSDAPKRDDVMNLIFGKMAMAGHPSLTDTYERMAKALAGVQAVIRREAPGRPEIFLFEVRRSSGRRLYVAWERREASSGKNAQPSVLVFEGALRAPTAIDAVGRRVPVEAAGGRISLCVPVTPLLIE